MSVLASNLFNTYLEKIQEDFRRGIATEHTHRSTLEHLLEAFEPGVAASNDPRHIDCGAPDFVVEKGKIPLGYVETKDIGESLDKIERGDQLTRYRKALNNLILTDYLEFRWYVRDELRLKSRIATVGKGRKLIVEPEGVVQLEETLQGFYREDVQTVATSKDLAVRLASQTHLVRELIAKALDAKDPGVRVPLEHQYKTFKHFLLPNITKPEFADLYAQTMTYGLFAAKLNAPSDVPFSRGSAYQYLASNHFLKRLFLDVGDELDNTIITPFLDDIATLLNRTNFTKILDEFRQNAQTQDPVVHFYETFLGTYDPKLRKNRGVYYTPEPVVSFIVRSVDQILKTHFKTPWGLADENVKVLDPAAGTGTFLYSTIRQVHQSLHQRGQQGTWPKRSIGLKKRIFGFEILMAPYVVSHLKLSLLLRELGAPLAKSERLQLFLTNALEEPLTSAETSEHLGFYIADEANRAALVKKQEPIMVVLGNPPYSGHSANTSVDHLGNPNFIGKLVREYYFVDGVPLQERNSKWLQDDYVKFIRFGEWRIQKTGYGILAFITNHGYLDNPTFRGMRQHLMRTFDEIYILDLHGNSKKKEQRPGGGRDENVFDIQQGVAIILAVKRKSSTGSPAKIHRADLWGLREEKYTTLQNKNLGDIDWKELRPEKPFYLFTPQDINTRHEYEQGWKLTDAMTINSAGIVTARDNLAIHFTENELFRTVEDFASLSTEGARDKYSLGSDVSDWKVSSAQSDVRSSGTTRSNIRRVLYRPFDFRFTYYTGQARGFLCRPRQEVMHHMLDGENFALITTRQTRDNWGVLATDNLSGHKSFAAYDINSFFPLYLYTTPSGTAGTLFAHSETTRTPNLSPAFISAFSEKLGLQFVQEGEGDLKNTFGPEDAFYYAYAVFHSPTYKTRYAEFLKMDFPRLPLTSDKSLFAQLVSKGKELVELHLLQTSKVDAFVTTYPEPGDNQVEQVFYTDGKVYINSDQYFGDLPSKVWSFKVGGYQVCEKWLKDRRGRQLSSGEIDHYQRVIVSLKETIKLINEIDKTILEWPIQ
jgi:hypothetical protein